MTREGLHPEKPKYWQCGQYQLELSYPLVMGILNVTPDSFSDGGRFTSVTQAVEAAQLMIEQGADIIDVGGESTRPGSDEVVPSEELSRVLPVVQELIVRNIVVSVDTRHAEVARACVEAGASIINDVSGFRDPNMVEVARGCDAGLVVMHMLGEPKGMQLAPQYEDVVRDISRYLCEQAQMLEEVGIAHERICIDPGPGFGKTTDHNLSLLRATRQLSELGWSLMVAVSRKRFVGEITGVAKADERVFGSIAGACYAVAHGAAVARVHDVAATVQAFRMLRAIQDVS